MAKPETRTELTHNGCLSILTSCFKPSGQSKLLKSKNIDERTTCAQNGDSKAVRPTATSSIMLPEQPSRDPTNTAIPDQVEEGDHKVAAPGKEEILPSTVDASELWQEALEQSDEEIKKKIKQLDKTEKSIHINQLISLVRDKRDAFKSDTPSISIHGKEVIWRDCAARAIGVITILGDIATSFAPSPSSAVWSALKVLLKANVTQCAEMVAVLGCIETVLPLVRRGAVYEHYLLRARSDDSRKSSMNLREALVEAYKQALKLLVRAECKVEENSIVRFWYTLQKSDEVVELIKDFRDAEDRVIKDAHACQVEQGQFNHDEFLERFGYLERTLQESTHKISITEYGQALDSVSQIHVGNQHHERTRHRLSGTGDWLLQHEGFLQWKESVSSGIMWLTGRVGAGKTVLTSHVIDRCMIDITEKSRATVEGLAYFYHSQETRCENSSWVLRSFVKQLFMLECCPAKLQANIMHRIGEAEKAHRTILTDEKCETLLLDFANEVSRTFLILDGLDEFPERDACEIIVSLTNLVRRSRGLVHLFVSSRDEGHIRNTLYAIEDQKALLEINIGHKNQTDIERFVEAEIEKSSKSYSTDQKRLLTEKLVGGADGMFRWTYLQMEQLEKCRTRTAVFQRLGHLPKGLTEAYNELYDKNEGLDKTYLQRAVKWVMFAYRPLSTDEFLSAIQLGQSDGGRLQIDDRLKEEELEELCRHLISKNSKNRWKFTHASVKEYFQDDQNERLKDWTGVTAQIELADLLILLLTSHEESPTERLNESSGDESNEEYGRESDGESLEKQPGARNVSLRPANPQFQHPQIILQKYAYIHWLSHVKAIQHLPHKCSQVSQHLKDFMTTGKEFHQSSLAYQKWVHFLQDCPYKGIIDMHMPRHSPRHLLPAENWLFGVVALGLFSMAEQWELSSLDLEQVNIVGADLLTVAAYFGYAETCAKLIAQGSDVNRILQYDGYGDGEIEKSSALLEATGQAASMRHANEQPYVQVVQVLLDNGADPNIETSCRALCQAACAGNLAMLEALLKGGLCDGRRIPADVGSRLSESVSFSLVRISGGGLL